MGGEKGAGGAPRLSPMSIYLDHAATTPMRPEAVEALTSALEVTGNASSLHGPGRAARRGLEEARERFAAALGARPSEVVWTAGGTEADNLAVKGLFWARRSHDLARRRILVSAVEHHAVLDPAFWLAEHAGAQVVLLDVDSAGRLDVEALEAELDAHGPEIALVSVMWANNEVGTLEPLDDVVAAAARHGVPVHADAVQAVGQVPVDFAASGLDALTVSGHKIGGPHGAGALLARRELELTPVIHGGGQERGVRSGTLNVPIAQSFAVAVELAVAEQAEFASRVGGLRDELVAAVRAAVPDAVLRGPEVGSGADDDGRGAMLAGPEVGSGAGADDDGRGAVLRGPEAEQGAGVGDGRRAPSASGSAGQVPERLPANALFTFAGCEGDSLLYLLDAAGIACSTGSACQAGVPQPSHVLLAMGVPEAEARGALRFSLGRTSTREDVAELAAALPDAVARARQAGLVSASG